MCGIIGYAGTKPVAPILLEGLERLEYRGYDSAGIALAAENTVVRTRAAGRLANLRAALEKSVAGPGANHSESLRQQTRGSSGGLAAPQAAGVGHTRWATHGAPTEQNAHPHQSNGGKYTLVHNGIIENYQALRTFLAKNGTECRTETDTEVIAQLLEFYDTGNPLETLRRVLPQLEGSYALAVLYYAQPGIIYAAKRKSPLLAAQSHHGTLLASDAAALLPLSRAHYRLEDGDLAVLTRHSIRFFDGEGQEQIKTPQVMSRHISAAEKKGYEHFMRKEMAEQPEAVRLTLEPLLRQGGPHLGSAEEALRGADRIDRVLFLGCGSAWHAGMCGCVVIEELAGVPAAAALASEFRSQVVTINQNTLVIVVSQSGETADTLMALRQAKAAGARTLGIINVEGSSIAEESGSVIFTRAGLEVAVATTKAYSAQLAAVYALAARLGQLRGTLGGGKMRAFLHALAALPGLLEETLAASEEEMLRWAEEIAPKEHAYFLGRNLDWAAALEGSLKLKEISYIHAEAYAAGELKHGTISLIEQGTPVVSVCMRPGVVAKTMSNNEEVRARGAAVYCLTNDPSVTARRRFLLPACHPLLGVSFAAVPLQLLAYHCARLRGCDIDKPRSLAKSVTVE
ncbi:MAG: glutamine--fructose-6-phosphate transaminase (isomerizing) [Oscillospiraceae bacterium]|jgi:glucosamine--fructose-6-phosphate aminotransferase (isomerizing)|nr:glutamine--fructose-6-phosphate transaminase (isomerizing) [Oscillospiraceae bacterium]